MAVFRIEKTSDFTIMSNHHLRNAELYEEGQTGNYNMLDGRLNNDPPERPDLTDGQTYGLNAQSI